ncbi:ArsR family transcriptional regulator [halophilic archaeon]|nr:ArsR family transcriptional regulator [halophilic archaeon]
MVTDPTQYDDALSTDDVFDLLADQRRRNALAVLRDRDCAVALPELAAETKARCDADPDRQDVEVSLHHAHVPRLAAAGVVRYDGSRVELTDAATQLDPFFELAEE